MDKNNSTKKPLTETQAEVLKFIEAYCRDSGVPPSYRDIQANFKYKSIGTVQDHLRALIAKGYLPKPNPKERQARSLVPENSSMKGVQRVPIYGEIAAGSAREADQVELGTLILDASSVKGEVFALRVVGDSMVDVGIYEGDLLIVQKTARARQGEIVVALLDGETTVKRYREQRGEIFLVPENRRMSPIPTKNRKLHIQGKVVGLQRKFH